MNYLNISRWTGNSTKIICRSFSCTILFLSCSIRTFGDHELSHCQQLAGPSGGLVYLHLSQAPRKCHQAQGMSWWWIYSVWNYTIIKYIHVIYTYYILYKNMCILMYIIYTYIYVYLFRYVVKYGLQSAVRWSLISRMNIATRTWPGKIGHHIISYAEPRSGLWVLRSSGLGRKEQNGLEAAVLPVIPGCWRLGKLMGSKLTWLLLDLHSCRHKRVHSNMIPISSIFLECTPLRSALFPSDRAIALEPNEMQIYGRRQPRNRCRSGWNPQKVIGLQLHLALQHHPDDSPITFPWKVRMFRCRVKLPEGIGYKKNIMHETLHWPWLNEKTIHR